MYIIQTINKSKVKGYAGKNDHVPQIQNMVHEGTYFFKSPKEAYAYIEKFKRYFYQLGNIKVLPLTQLLNSPNVVIQSKDMLKEMVKEDVCNIYIKDNLDEKQYIHYDEDLEEYFYSSKKEGACIWEKSKAITVCNDFIKFSNSTHYFEEIKF